MSEPSFLPENLRSKEQALQKKAGAAAAEPGVLKMHIPASTADEDIEIIEVDESDLGAILADEPFFTRLSYRLSLAFDAIRHQIFASKEQAPPPKLPPQFFTPPKSGLSSLGAAGASGKAGAPGAPVGLPRSRARITPNADVPRRVRVIRRVRKPVRVSLISAEELMAYRVDVGKRKWTIAVCCILFVLIIGGGYRLLTVRVTEARTALRQVETDILSTRSNIVEREKQWASYSGLQQRLTTLDDLLNNHVIVTRLFDFLEARTLPEVAYHSATLSADSVLSLEVSASSYAAAARQLVSFERSPFVQKVDASSFSAQVDGESGAVTEVSFQLGLQLDPRALRGPRIAQSTDAVSTSPTDEGSTTP